MPKHTEQFQCETDGRYSERLYQSYADGSMQCGPCALKDPFMRDEQRRSIGRRMQRAEQARKNFGHPTKEAQVNV
jgi:hypothetical protein